MRLRPALLLLLLASAPLAGAAVDPGARELLEFTDTTAGLLAPGNGRILVGTADPGSNEATGGFPLGENPGADAAVWFLYEPDGLREIDAGSADPESCYSATGFNHESPSEDCSSPVEALAINELGTRFVVATRSESGITLRFEPTPGSPSTFDISAGGGVPRLAIDRAGSTVAVAHQTVGLTWNVRAYDWDGKGGVTEKWDEPYSIGTPDGFDLSPDGSRIVVTSGEDYHRIKTSDQDATTDNSFVGTGGGIAISDGGSHTSVMGTSAGRLRFHDDTTKENDRRLTFKRADSPITTMAITDKTLDDDGDSATEDVLFVAWGNEAGTLGIGQLAPVANFFQVLTEVDLGAEPDFVTMNQDGTVVVAITGDTVHAFGRSGLEAFPLWNTTLEGNLGTASITDDGDTILVPVPAGIQLYDAVYDLNVTSDAPTLKPGTAGELTLRLRNDGNRLVSTPVSALPVGGWTIAPREAEAVVAPGETVEVVVDVTPPATQAPGSFPLTFETRGPDGKSVKHNVALQLEEVVDWAIGLRDGADPTLSAEAGAPVVFQLFIQNKGNVLDEAPLRTTVSDGDWTVGFDSGDGEIQPGDTADLDIVVTPPSDALELDEATITVALSGFADSEIDLRAVVGAVFGVELDVPGGVTIEAGKSKTFNVTVRNIGNTEDGATVRFGDLPTGWTGSFEFNAVEAKVKDIPAKGEKRVQATITVPEDADTSAPFLVFMSASSFGPSDGDARADLLVSVEEAVVEEPEEDSPGLPLVGLLAAVGVAFAVRRRD